MKIAIVGSQEDKWTEEQKLKAKQEILTILAWRGYHSPILVSGHCPKGGVDICAEEIADKLGIKKMIFEPEVNQWEDKKVCPKCYEMQGANIDQWISDKKWCTWHGQNCQDRSKEITIDMFVNKMGYKSRNIKIAEECDVLYCIVPEKNSMEEFNPKADWQTKGDYCMHCDIYGHQRNGGCWTMKYCKSLNKETHLIVVK